MKRQRYELSSPRLKAQLLYYSPVANGVGFDPPIPIPYGVGIRPSDVNRRNPEDRRYNFFIEARDGSYDRVIATRQGTDDSGALQLFPPAGWTAELQQPNEGIQIRFFILNSYVEWIAARQVILRSHYVSSPAHGMFLACAFVNGYDQERIRVERRNSEHHTDPWSAAWHEPAGGIIGCAVLSKMYHGMPSGRLTLGQRLGHDPEVLRTKGRDAVVKELGLACATRFAVDAPYRRLGIGSLLAHGLKHVAQPFFDPTTRVIEVMRTLPAEEAERLAAGIPAGTADDFLSRAGYTVVPHTTPSIPIIDRDAATAAPIQVLSARKLYYYHVLHND